MPEGPLLASSKDELIRKHQCRCIVPSPWVKDLYERCGNVKIPILSLPFGVDTHLFKPSLTDNNKVVKTNIFIYHKGRTQQDLEFVLQLIPKQYTDHNKMRIFVYGGYNRDEYRTYLQTCKFGIWVGAHESQGFALQEALSCDVPLIVWNVKSMYEEYAHGRFIYENVRYLRGDTLGATTTSFWNSEMCGIIVYDKKDMKEAIERMETLYIQYSPRTFVLNTLSDDVCMQRLLDAF